MEVFKFGGASLKDAPGYLRMLNLVLRYPGQLVVVISALGKTTNALEEVVKSYLAQDGRAFDLLTAIKQHHFDIIQQLELQDQLLLDLLNELAVEIEWMLEDEPDQSDAYIYDQIVGVGEMWSSAIFEALLRKHSKPSVWIDVRDVMKTDDTHRAAQVQWDLTRENVHQIIHPQLNNDRVVVTQGFVGATDDNYTTTLGREGSDYSGAVLAALCKAKRLTVWKDVPGIMTADPDLDDRATLIPEIDYAVARKMASLGAKVVHPNTMKPMAEQGIPITVRSFIDLDNPGTTIGHFHDLSYPVMTMLRKNIRFMDFDAKAKSAIDAVLEKCLSIPFYKESGKSKISIAIDRDDRCDVYLQQIEGKIEMKDGYMVTLLYSDVASRVSWSARAPFHIHSTSELTQYFFADHQDM